MEVARWHAEIVEEPVGEGGVDFEDPSVAVTARGILATRLPTGAVHAGDVANVLHMIRRTRSVGSRLRAPRSNRCSNGRVPEPSKWPPRQAVARR